MADFVSTGAITSLPYQINHFLRRVSCYSILKELIREMPSSGCLCPYLGCEGVCDVWMLHRMFILEIIELPLERIVITCYVFMLFYYQWCWFFPYFCICFVFDLFICSAVVWFFLCFPFSFMLSAFSLFSVFFHVSCFFIVLRFLSLWCCANAVGQFPLLSSVKKRFLP